MGEEATYSFRAEHILLRTSHVALYGSTGERLRIKALGLKKGRNAQNFEFRVKVDRLHYVPRHKKRRENLGKKLTFYPLSPAAQADKAEFFTSILSSFFLSRHTILIGLTLTALKTI